ncbi:MAG TPA: TlpA disulfide reductase family protein [Sphingobacteriaceae bacterium]
MMKKTYLLAVLCICFSLALFGQQAATVPTLNENSVVRDSSGYQYPYAVWSKLFHSGSYGIRTTGTRSAEPTFLLYRLSDAQIAARMERLPKPRASAAFRTGSKLANLKAVDINGNKYNLKDLAGKVVVLNFWFINCPPCRQEIPALNEMVSRYKGNPDVVFLAIGLDEPQAIREFLKTQPFNYQVVDRGQYLASQYRVKAYPTHVVLDKAGVVAFHTEGLAMNTILWIDQTIQEKLKEDGNL